MALTESQRLSFALWIVDMLRNNKKSIDEANREAKFDHDGHLKALEKRNGDYKDQEGILTSLEEQKIRQTKIANRFLDELYRKASAIADVIVGHVGKDHELARLIRNQRDSMALEAGRGPETLPDTSGGIQ